MGCKSTRTLVSDLSSPQNLFEIPSKRFQALTFLEKPGNIIEFSLKIVPYNSEIERVSTISLEFSCYNLQNRPPFACSMLDLFYNSDEDLLSEEKLCFKVQISSFPQEKFLLKMVSFQDFEDYAFKSALYEIFLLKKLEGSRNLIRLRHFFLNDFGKNRKKFVVFLFEDADFTLADLLIFRKGTKKPFSEEELLRLMRELSEIGLSLESHDICHRDLRPENFWYSFKENLWKLANFSSARHYQLKENEAFSHDLIVNTFRGKREFLAPEVEQAYQESHEKKVENFNAYMNDVYAMGLVFLMLSRTELSLEKQLISQAQVMESWEDALSVEIICKMMNSNTQRRPFFANVKEMIGEEPRGTRKIESSVYAELKQLRESQAEQTLSLKILKQEKFAHAYFKLLQTDHSLSQFDELLSFFEVHSDEENRANTLKEIGDFSDLLGNTSKAKELYSESLRIYNILGQQARKSGNFSKAVALYEKALGISGRLYASKDLNFLQVLENCGNAYRLCGRFSDAKQCQEKALGILIQVKGESSLEVARLLNNLANTYAGLKEYDRSIELLRSSTRTLREQGSKESPNLLAMALCNLGEMYRHKGQLLDAKTVIEEALIIKEKLFGVQPNLEVASALDNLGNVYYDLLEFAKAKKLYEKALIMKEAVLDEFNVEIAISLNNLGNAARCLKELKVAEGYYKKGLQIHRTQTREKHVNYAAMCGNLGLVYIDMGKKKEARFHLCESCKIFKEKYGDNDPDYRLFKKELDKIS